MVLFKLLITCAISFLQEPYLTSGNYSAEAKIHYYFIALLKQLVGTLLPFIFIRESVKCVVVFFHAVQGRKWSIVLEGKYKWQESRILWQTLWLACGFGGQASVTNTKPSQ